MDSETMRADEVDQDVLCERVADAIPLSDMEPKTMNQIYSAIPPPRAPRPMVERLVASLVDDGEVAMFGLGPRTMGNGGEWLHYRWVDA